MPAATRKKSYSSSSKGSLGTVKTYKVTSTVVSSALDAQGVGGLFEYRLDDALYDRDIESWEVSVTEA